MLPWFLFAVVLLWALYERLRPRRVVVMYSTSSEERVEELMTQCIDLRTQNEDLRELVADILVDMDRLMKRYRGREHAATVE